MTELIANRNGWKYPYESTQDYGLSLSLNDDPQKSLETVSQLELSSGHKQPPSLADLGLGFRVTRAHAASMERLYSK